MLAYAKSTSMLETPPLATKSQFQSSFVMGKSDEKPIPGQVDKTVLELTPSLRLLGNPGLLSH